MVTFYHLSNEKKTACLGYIGDEILPSSMGIAISHFKHPVMNQPVYWDVIISLERCSVVVNTSRGNTDTSSCLTVHFAEVFVGRHIDQSVQNPRLGGGFNFFNFSPLFGEDFHFDSYFSDGLKPPTRRVLFWSKCLIQKSFCFYSPEN